MGENRLNVVKGVCVCGMGRGGGGGTGVRGTLELITRTGTTVVRRPGAGQ